jgi:hypothetical protein
MYSYALSVLELKNKERPRGNNAKITQILQAPYILNTHLATFSYFLKLLNNVCVQCLISQIAISYDTA